MSARGCKWLKRPPNARPPSHSGRLQVGRAKFETERRRYTILDAPGHKNYVPNMIMGAAQVRPEGGGAGWGPGGPCCTGWTLQDVLSLTVLCTCDAGCRAPLGVHAAHASHGYAHAGLAGLLAQRGRSQRHVRARPALLTCPCRLTWRCWSSAAARASTRLASRRAGRWEALQAGVADIAANRSDAVGCTPSGRYSPGVQRCSGAAAGLLAHGLPTPAMLPGSHAAQTREHAQLAKTLGVVKLVVVVNKLDDSSVVGEGGVWAHERYDGIVAGLTPFLKSAGYNPKKDLTFIPISALSGHNVKARARAWARGKVRGGRSCPVRRRQAARRWLSWRSLLSLGLPVLAVQLTPYSRLPVVPPPPGARPL